MDLHTFPPVCLPDQDQQFEGLEGLVYGWGAQEAAGTDPATVLQKAQVGPVGVIRLNLCIPGAYCQFGEVPGSDEQPDCYPAKHALRRR